MYWRRGGARVENSNPTTIEYWDSAGAGRNTPWKVDESGSKGAQHELYSSIWALQLDLDHFRKTMVLTRF